MKEEKFVLERQFSKTAPYKFCKYQCIGGQFLYIGGKVLRHLPAENHPKFAPNKLQ